MTTHLADVVKVELSVGQRAVPELALLQVLSVLEEHRKEMTFLANLETLSLPKFVDLSQANPWTKFCAPIVRSPIFKQSVELVLWANMILLVIQYDGQGEMLAYIDEILQGVFTACFTMRPSWS